MLIHTFGHEQQEGHFNTKTALRNGTLSWTIHIVLHLYTQTYIYIYIHREPGPTWADWKLSSILNNS